MSSNRLVLLLKAPKAEEQSDPYVESLKAEGLKAGSVPALGFSFINLNQLHDALHTDVRHSCLVLTSPRSVEAIHHVFASHPDDREELCQKWSFKPTFVVGQATARAASQLGLKPVGADTGNASNLAPFVVSKLKESSQTEREVLLPCGQLSIETLPNILRDEGIAVHSLTVYETSVDPALAANINAFIQKLGRPQFIVFFSPSIVRLSQPVLNSLDLLHSSVELIAIGPTTEEAMKSELGRVSGTAARPTPKHICDIILQLSMKTERV